MADNIFVNEGAGPKEVKTKAVGQVHQPYARLIWGASDAEPDGTGDNDLPVQSADGALFTIGSVLDKAALQDDPVGGGDSLMSVNKRTNGRLTSILTSMQGQSGTPRSGIRPSTATAGGVALTNTMSPVLILAALGSGLYHMLGSLIVANSSATGALVTITAGSGGRVVTRVYVPPTSTVPVNFFPALPVDNNAAVYAVSSASVDSIYVTAVTAQVA